MDGGCAMPDAHRPTNSREGWVSSPTGPRGRAGIDDSLRITAGLRSKLVLHRGRSVTSRNQRRRWQLPAAVMAPGSRAIGGRAGHRHRCQVLLNRQHLANPAHFIILIVLRYLVCCVRLTHLIFGQTCRGGTATVAGWKACTARLRSSPASRTVDKRKTF
jgi:hypothetical protein